MIPLSRIPHRVAVPALLALFVVCGIASVAGDSATFDETPHLAAGVSYLERGDFRMNPEHPPLAKIVAALPVLALRRGGGDYASDAWNGTPSTGRAAGRTAANEWIFGYEFLNGPRGDPARRDPAFRLFPARCAMLLLGALLCLVVYAWTRQMSGPGAGLLALALAVTCPTILAHARLVATDLPGGLGIVTTLWLFRRWTLVPSWPRALLTGIALGVALLLKFNAALLALVLVALAALAVVAGRVRLPRAAGAVALIAASSFVAVWAGYGFRYSASSDPGYTLDWEGVAKMEPGIPASVTFATRHQLLPEAYLFGLAYVRAWASGRFAFLDGEESIRGWYRYFPEAFLFKTPIAFILLAGWTAGAAIRRTRGRGLDGWIVALPLAAFASSSILSRFNIGHRHLAPLYPLLCVATGPAAGWLEERSRRGALATALVAGCALSFALATPSYLSYFNVLAGGSRGGWRHLVDSNVDWGQDLGRLSSWMRAHRVPSVDLAYFGTADPSAYGIEFRKVARFMDFAPDVAPSRPASGAYLAASVTLLQGVYLDGDRAFLRESLRRGWVARDAVAEYLRGAELARDRGDGVPHAAEWLVDRGAMTLAQRREIEDVLPAGWMRRVRDELTPVDRIGGSILVYKIP